MGTEHIVAMLKDAQRGDKVTYRKRGHNKRHGTLCEIRDSYIVVATPKQESVAFEDVTEVKKEEE